MGVVGGVHISMFTNYCYFTPELSLGGGAVLQEAGLAIVIEMHFFIALARDASQLAMTSEAEWLA